MTSLLTIFLIPKQAEAIFIDQRSRGAKNKQVESRSVWDLRHRDEDDDDDDDEGTSSCDCDDV